eukprot:GHVR01128355.1.p1 GENE.GHVR01128355.1~~GHVR01128355.1.p1  ORF type:complete len:838 (+),score=240.58 GHVR01128355.1:1458-3971(+)
MVAEKVSDMTNSKCMSMCSNSPTPYSYSATLKGQDCLCGNSTPPTLTSSASCDYSCEGAGSFGKLKKVMGKGESCGGDSYVDVYTSTCPKDAKPVVVAEPAVVDKCVSGPNLGCFDFLQPDHPGWVWVREETYDLTLEACASLCRSKGKRYSGTFKGQDCICGDSMPSLKSVSNSQCDVNCSGDLFKKCGGSHDITVWDTNCLTCGKSLGCYHFEEAEAERDTYTQAGRGSHMTNAVCMDMCGKNNMMYAATLGGDSCYCSDKLPHKHKSNVWCDVACSGNSSADKFMDMFGKQVETCGSNDDVNIYSVCKTFNDATSTTTKESTGGKTNVTPVFIPTNNNNGTETQEQNDNDNDNDNGNDNDNVAKEQRTTTVPPPTKSCGGPVGCYSFQREGSDRLGYEMVAEKVSDMTNSKCMSMCSNSPTPYSYSATLKGQDCLCGNSTPPKITKSSSCDYSCDGDGTMSRIGGFFGKTLETCGGSHEVNVYKLCSKPGAEKCDLGCYKFNRNDREGWVWQSEDSAVSVRTCQKTCASQKKKYGYAALFKGKDCLCGGKKITLDSNPMAQCDVHCADGDVCGGSHDISIWSIPCLVNNGAVVAGAGVAGAVVSEGSSGGEGAEESSEGGAYGKGKKRGDKGGKKGRGKGGKKGRGKGGEKGGESEEKENNEEGILLKGNTTETQEEQEEEQTVGAAAVPSGREKVGSSGPAEEKKLEEGVTPCTDSFWGNCKGFVKNLFGGHSGYACNEDCYYMQRFIIILLLLLLLLLLFFIVCMLVTSSKKEKKKDKNEEEKLLNARGDGIDPITQTGEDTRREAHRSTINTNDNNSYNDELNKSADSKKK